MSDIRPLQVAGSGVHSTDNIACSRSDLREAREREERARLNPQQELTPAQRIGQAYENLYRQEQEHKAKERARLIAEGKIVINPDGSETHHLRGNRY